VKSIIHIAQQAIAKNRKHGTFDPPVIVRTSKKSQRCQEAIIRDKDGHEVARIVHSPHKPLSCGARVWIETSYNVEMIQTCRSSDQDTGDDLNEASVTVNP
jgi:hypothetical protein